MTQTPPDVDPRTISAPVVITAGSTVQIPYPTNAPQIVMWVVLYNSSPYTIAVESDTTLGQVAAFTSDAFPVVSGTPITCTALPGAGVITPGSDSSIYSTWYRQQPPGTFPAALGSGEANLAVPTTIAANQVSAVAVGATVKFPLSAAPFSTAGYGGAIYRIKETSTFAPLFVTVSWYADAAGALLITSRSLVIAPSGSATFALPHLGPYFTLSVNNQGGATAAVNVFISATVLPFACWAVTGGGSGAVELVDSTAVSTPATGQALIGAAGVTYAGPVTLHALVESPGVAAGCGVFAFYRDATGASKLLSGITFPAGGFAGTFVAPVTFIAPPFPLTIQAFNSTAAPVSIRASLVADDWRFAA